MDTPMVNRLLLYSVTNVWPTTIEVEDQSEGEEEIIVWHACLHKLVLGGECIKCHLVIEDGSFEEEWQ